MRDSLERVKDVFPVVVSPGNTSVFASQERVALDALAWCVTLTADHR